MLVYPWQQVLHPTEFMRTDTVHIWRVHLKATRRELNQAKNLLSIDELHYGQELIRSELRESYWLAHAWMRRILSQYLDHYGPQELSFTKSEYGKPYLKLPIKHDVQFNMSYSANMALIVVTRCSEIGVDIERIDPNINYLELAEHFFSPVEYKQLNNLPDAAQLSAFYRMWTLKEAVIKALGKGLSYPLASFEVDLAPDFQHCLRNLFEPEPEQWSVFSFVVAENYPGAVAVPMKLTYCYCLDVGRFA